MGSGFKSFTAGSVLTASDVNNYLMEQSIMYFATEAARNSAITSPEDGMVCYIGSNDANEGLYTYHGSAWRKPWNLPWGYVTDSVLGSNVSGTAGNWTSGTTATFTVPANRRIRVEASATIYNNGASNSEFTLGVGPTLGTPIRQNGAYFAPGFRATITAYHIYTSTASSVTERLQFVGLSSAPLLLLGAQLLITDLGPAGAPL